MSNYSKLEPLYQIFLEKLHEWYLKGNTRILYHFLQEYQKDIPYESIEELTIRAIADGFLESSLLCHCPKCNNIIIQTKIKPNDDKEFYCEECDSELYGIDLTIMLQLTLTKKIIEKDFFRNRKNGLLLRSENCSF